ncbi:MAG: alpha/beta hydrolase [Halofilum sp. (in: g-proteobacteria)]|nr:alpha/beta hydrolase [Halofilum sp. (in: g-proteobacteria)]
MAACPPGSPGCLTRDADRATGRRDVGSVADSGDRPRCRRRQAAPWLPPGRRGRRPAGALLPRTAGLPARGRSVRRHRRATGIAADRLERPGYGITSPLPDRAIGDEARDAAAIADRLDLERFDVIGFSGGGPPALACAARMPERVERVTLVGSFAPFDAAGLDGMLEAYRGLWELAASDFPAFAQAVQDALTQAGGPYELFLGGAPESDRAILEQPEFAGPYHRDLEEALRQPQGMLDDAAAVISGWSFDCSDVQCPVHLFHGERDGNAPVAMHAG